MSLAIRPEWLSAPDHGSDAPELASDEATLAAITISAGDECLSRLSDESGQERDYVCVSAYQLAHWITRNWWRFLFEAERHRYSNDPIWLDGHSLASIGEGWLWPRISIAADGDLVVLRSRPSEGDEVEPLAFMSEAEVRVSRSEFAHTAERFVEGVVDRLKTWNVEDSDLDCSWRELNAERSDGEVTQYRELEGSLGYEPDGASPQTVERLYRDRERLGASAMTEVAANGRSGATPLTAQTLEQEARNSGFVSDLGSPSLMNDLADEIGPASEPAWSFGEEAAREVRRKAGFGDGPLANRRLSELCGADAAGLTDDTRYDGLAFALCANGKRGRVVLRSRWETGRRFELARLLGDGLLFASDERLHPATKSETFRQRVQRAFAAELLCPYDALRDFLRGDTSAMARDEAARHFHVSSRAVTTILVNKHDLSRDQLPLHGD